MIDTVIHALGSCLSVLQSRQNSSWCLQASPCRLLQVLLSLAPLKTCLSGYEQMRTWKALSWLLWSLSPRLDYHVGQKYHRQGLWCRSVMQSTAYACDRFRHFIFHCCAAQVPTIAKVWTCVMHASKRSSVPRRWNLSASSWSIRLGYNRLWAIKEIWFLLVMREQHLTRCSADSSWKFST